MKRLLPMVLMLLLPQLVGGDESKEAWTGNYLYESCDEYLKVDDGRPFSEARASGCISYIIGTVNGYDLAAQLAQIVVSGAEVGDRVSFRPLCIPEGVTNPQLVRIVHNHLRENPEQNHQLAAPRVILAMGEAYPCEESEAGADEQHRPPLPQGRRRQDLARRPPGRGPSNLESDGGKT